MRMAEGRAPVMNSVGPRKTNPCRPPGRSAGRELDVNNVRQFTYPREPNMYPCAERKINFALKPDGSGLFAGRKAGSARVPCCRSLSFSVVSTSAQKGDSSPPLSRYSSDDRGCVLQLGSMMMAGVASRCPLAIVKQTYGQRAFFDLHGRTPHSAVIAGFGLPECHQQPRIPAGASSRAVPYGGGAGDVFALPQICPGKWAGSAAAGAFSPDEGQPKTAYLTTLPARYVKQIQHARKSCSSTR